MIKLLNLIMLLPLITVLVLAILISFILLITIIIIILVLVHFNMVIFPFVFPKLYHCQPGQDCDMAESPPILHLTLPLLGLLRHVPSLARKLVGPQVLAARYLTIARAISIIAIS